MWWIIGIILIWVLGICLDVSTRTDVNHKFHEGGFLNMGYVTSGKRDANPRDMWWAMIWPIRLVFFFICGFLWLFHDFIALFLLVFSYQYKKTEMYKKIDKWLGSKM